MLFKNYEYFLAITEAKNLSEAAEKLFISQPSLSKYLKRLEDNLGIELFDHHSSPLKLTYAGERYLEYVTTVAELDSQLQKEFSEIKKNDRGKLTLGLALWRSSYMLPEILPVFSKKYPNIEVKVVEGKSDFLINEMLKQRLDLCILNPVSNLNYQNLDYEVLMYERILLLANRDHPLIHSLFPESGASGNPAGIYPHLDLSLIEKEQFFLTKAGQNLTVTISSFFSKHHLHPSRIFETENLTTAINMVAAGMGFTFVPEAGAAPGNLPPNLALFTIDEPPLQWPLAVFYKRSSYVTHAAQHFVNLLKERYH